MLSEKPKKDYQDKRLRGSGGYVLAKITEEEQRKGNLGGPELFLAGVGRLDENRLLRHYCNRCEEEFDGPPSIVYDNPNEDLGEGVVLEEKGEYKCKKCKNTIAQYRKFRTPQDKKSVQDDLSSVSHQEASQQVSSAKPEETSGAFENSAPSPVHEVHNALVNGDFLPIHSLIEMPAYDSEAMLLGNIKEIGLRRLKRPKLLKSCGQRSLKLVTLYLSTRIGLMMNPTLMMALRRSGNVRHAVTQMKKARSFVKSVVLNYEIKSVVL